MQRTTRLKFALIALGLSALGGVAVRGGSQTNAPVDFTAPPIDASFTNGLAVVTRTSGFQEIEFAAMDSDWQTNLCLMLGIRVDAGPKRFVRLIEVVTLAPPPPANTLSNVSFQCASLFLPGRLCHFTSPRYPIRIRVFDEQGHFLDEDHRSVPWQFLTNGVAAAPLVIKALPKFAALINGPEAGKPFRPSPGTSIATNEAQALLEAEGTDLRGIAALLALFKDTLAATALAETRDHASAVALKPNWLKVIVNLGLHLNLDPDFDHATILSARGVPTGETIVAFPVTLWQDKRLLLSSEFIAGPTKGAHFLTSGVRGIRATHLAKPDHHLLIQVIAAGLITTNANPASTPLAP